MSKWGNFSVGKPRCPYQIITFGRGAANAQRLETTVRDYNHGRYREEIKATYYRRCINHPEDSLEGFIVEKCIKFGQVETIYEVKFKYPVEDWDHIEYIVLRLEI